MNNNIIDIKDTIKNKFRKGYIAIILNNAIMLNNANIQNEDFNTNILVNNNSNLKKLLYRL